MACVNINVHLCKMLIRCITHDGSAVCKAILLISLDSKQVILQL